MTIADIAVAMMFMGVCVGFIWFVGLFDEFHWYRRLIGGHWERWEPGGLGDHWWLRSPAGVCSPLNRSDSGRRKMVCEDYGAVIPK